LQRDRIYVPNRLAELASTAGWIHGAQGDGRWDRQPRPMMAGSNAPSSRQLTANGEALTRQQIIALAGELVEPPEPAPPARGFAKASNLAGAA
jgi:hypothetical protein